MDFGPDMTTGTMESVPSAYSTLEHLMSSNVTSIIHYYPKELVMAVPRMMARAGSFAFVTVPERIDYMLGLRHGGSMIAEATGHGIRGNRSRDIVSAALSGASSSGTDAPTAAGAAAAEGSRGLSSLSFNQVRNFGGIFTYMTSKWALACFTLVSLQFVMRPLFSSFGFY